MRFPILSVGIVNVMHDTWSRMRSSVNQIKNKFEGQFITLEQVNFCKRIDKLGQKYDIIENNGDLRTEVK